MEPQRTPSRSSEFRRLVASGWLQILLLPLSALACWYYGGVLNRAYPIRDWLFWQVGVLWLWGLVHSLACLSAGHVVLKRALRIANLSALETLVHSFALGVVLFTLAMYAVGALGVFNSWFGVALPVTFIALGGPSLVPLVRQQLRARQSGWSLWARVAACAGVCCVVFVYLEAMTPETINYDAAWYHMTAAQDYARESRIVPFYSDNNRAFPQLAAIQYTWGWLVPGISKPQRWMMAIHLEFLGFLWTLAGVSAAARYILGDQPARATWAAFFLFPAIYVYDSNLGGSADHFLAIFAAPVFLATARAAENLDVRRCILTGIFLAGALLTKYQAAYFIVATTVILAGACVLAAWRARPSGSRPMPWRRTLAKVVIGPAAVGLTMFAVSSPHFIKNIIYHHNPVFPFAQTFFRGSYPQNPTSVLCWNEIQLGHDLKPTGSLLQKLSTTLDVGITNSFEPHYSFTQGIPMLGSLFVLLIPFAFFVEGRRRLWLGIAWTQMALFAWGWTYYVDRYLQAIIPMMAAVTGAILVRAVRLGWLSRIAIAPLVALQIVWGGDAIFYNGGGRLLSAINLIKNGVLGQAATRFDGYRSDLVAASNSLPKDAQVLLYSHHISLGLDRRVVLDVAHTGGLVYYNELKGPRALYDYYSSLGITHVGWRTPSSDANTKQADVLISEFVTNYGTNRSSFGSLNIVELPKSPPPPDTEYRVVSLGTPFTDGVYELTQLAIHEGLPERFKHMPHPLVIADSSASELADIFEAVRAVLIRRNLPIDSKARAVLVANFTLGLTFNGHEVWVRKPNP